MKKAAGGSECGYCGRHELERAPLALCLRCKLVSYCSQDCQKAHWRRNLAGHKQFCLTLEQRTPAAAEEASPKGASAAVNECTICLTDLDAEATTTLECSHRFHVKCIELQKAVSKLKACPSCRGELKEQTPKKTADITFDQAVELHKAITGLESQGKLSWVNLSTSHQRAMDRVVKAYKREGDYGSARAQMFLAEIYQYGEGVHQDYTHALRWYRTAAEQGIPKAQSNLGRMHKHGQGVPQDYKKALRWYHKAAEQGFANAQNDLGSMHEHGLGVPQDYKEGARWYRKAASQGHADAQSSLGYMYFNCKGVPRDYKEALRWYHMAAKQNISGAQYIIGLMYRNGKGAPRNFKDALQWFHKAAKQGNADAQYHVGLMFENGEGVPANSQEAQRWFRKAADKGHIDATKKLNKT